MYGPGEFRILNFGGWGKGGGAEGVWGRGMGGEEFRIRHLLRPGSIGFARPHPIIFGSESSGPGPPRILKFGPPEGRIINALSTRVLDHKASVPDQFRV
jgi:hypothetical protein